MNIPQAGQLELEPKFLVDNDYQLAGVNRIGQCTDAGPLTPRYPEERQNYRLRSLKPLLPWAKLYMVDTIDHKYRRQHIPRRRPQQLLDKHSVWIKLRGDLVGLGQS